MKRTVLLLAMAAVCLTSCKEDPIEATPVVTIDGATGNELLAKELTSKEQEFTIKVLSSGEYTVEIPTAAQLWLEEVKSASTRALTSSEVKFKVKAHSGLDPREAIITLKCGDFSQKYKIIQNPLSGAITVDIADVNIAQMTTADSEGVQTINGVSNRGLLIPLRVGPTAAFDVWVDESTPWLSVQSSEGNQDVNIQVGTTYNIPSDPFDYSESRIGVVNFRSKDKQFATKLIIKQNPRVAGDYVLTAPDPEDPAPTDAATSQLGKHLLAEVPGFRIGITTIKVSGPMTEFDFMALAFTGDWLTGENNMNNIAPKMSTLDLSEAVFETIPEAFLGTKSGSTNTLLRKVILPAGVKTISTGAFQYCTSLEEVNIPSGVETIGDNAFYNAPLNISLVIPRSLTSLGVDAFRGNRFSGLSFEEPAEQFCKDGTSRLAISNGAFLTGGSTLPASRGGSLSEDLVIPEWVNAIGNQSFGGLFFVAPDSPTEGNPTRSTEKATIKIGKNVESIGYGAFAWNIGVVKFDFGTGGKPITLTQNNSTNVADGLFARSGITEFTWPIEGRQITVVNADASEIPDGVSYLPSNIVLGCVNLKKSNHQARGHPHRKSRLQRNQSGNPEHHGSCETRRTVPPDKPCRDRRKRFQQLLWSRPGAYCGRDGRRGDQKRNSRTLGSAQNKSDDAWCAGILEYGSKSRHRRDRRAGHDGDPIPEDHPQFPELRVEQQQRA
jgi:hypothetical protein